MIRKDLKIGRWAVEFYFATDSYDVDTLLDRLFDFGASGALMRQAMDLMERGDMNTGFTFTNSEERIALVAIGPTRNGEQFVNTLVHELYHVATAISRGLGIDLDSEAPAYIIGDSALELMDAVCQMGCRSCR